MKLSTTVIYKAPREKVFAALTDPETLRKCIDGCEKMEKTGEDAYDAHLKIGVAGMKGAYTGKVALKDKAAPESFTLHMEGKGGPGWVKGSAKISLLPQGEGTELRCEGEGQVGGLIAAVGSRLVEAAGKRMLDEFFRKLGEQLQAV